MSIEEILPLIGKGKIESHTPVVDDIPHETIKMYSANLDNPAADYEPETLLGARADGTYFARLILHGNLWSPKVRQSMLAAEFLPEQIDGTTALVARNIEIGPDWDIEVFVVTVDNPEPGKKRWTDKLTWKHRESGDVFETLYNWVDF